MKNKKIVLVDDDPSILESLEIILKYEGYDVLLARSGADVKSIIKKHTPDLFILNYQLPRENGAKITQFLRKNTATRNIPIIVISANQKIENEVKNAGATDFFEKPFNIDAFLTKVRQRT